MRCNRWFGIAVVATAWCVLLNPQVFCAEPATQRVEHFDRDPGWEGVNNRIARDRYPTIKQDFGYADGQIGGQVWRSSTPAWYAVPIEPAVTLDEPLSASGTFVVPKSASSTGVSFGWFNHDVTPGTRPMNSLLFQINGERTGVQIHVRAISAHNRSAGATVARPGAAKRDMLFAPGPDRHRWSIQYDPAGKGTVTIRVDDLAAVSYELSEEVRKDGITADRFGIVNHLKSGSAMTFYLDDVKVGDKTFDFAADPDWQSSGSRTSFEDREIAGDQNFGYSETNFGGGGGTKGEIGGTVWRGGGGRAWYADRIGPLDLAQPLHASGKIILKVGAPDSGVYFGWFNGASARQDTQRCPPNFLGAHIEGPTRVGHYFAPEYAPAKGERRRLEQAAILAPDGRSHAFAIDYDPATRELRTTLDGHTTTLIVRPEDQKAGASFDRFGLLNVGVGGQQVKLYLDDLTYTAR
jgi:hypothetical protein